MTLRWAKIPVVFVLLLSAFFCGCGTSAYDTAMADKLKQLKMAAPFTKLAKVPVIDGTSVQIFVPKEFQKQLTEGMVDEHGKVDPQRVQPFMKLPGFKFSYEAMGKVGTEEVTYYCYVAVLPSTAPEVATLANDLLAAIKKEFPTWSGTWQDISVDTPTGEKSNWQYVSVEGQMFFDTQATGTDKAEFKKLPAKFELWLHENEHYRVLLGWRISDELEKQVGLFKMAPLTAGSISIGPPPAPAAEGNAAEGAPNE